MRVLIACEFSGVVRRAFRALGHEAHSCDLLPAEDNSPYHYKLDILELLKREEFDLMIAHPPCDYLTVSGNRWFKDNAKAKAGILTGQKRRDAQAEAVEFVKALWNCGIPKIAIENPIGRLSTLWMKPSQTVQLFWFGEPFFKSTCLWIKGLQPLVATNKLVPPLKGTKEYKAWSEIHRATPSENRKKDRSRLKPGFAQAMAEQWSNL